MIEENLRRGRVSPDSHTRLTNANIVADERQSNRFRSSAYFGLFQVAAIDARSLPEPDFRFPDDVDWNLVSSFAPNADVVKHPA
jgi:hypothetical protein